MVDALLQMVGSKLQTKDLDLSSCWIRYSGYTIIFVHESICWIVGFVGLIVGVDCLPHSFVHTSTGKL